MFARNQKRAIGCGCDTSKKGASMDGLVCCHPGKISLRNCNQLWLGINWDEIHTMASIQMRNDLHEGVHNPIRINE